MDIKSQNLVQKNKLQADLVTLLQKVLPAIIESFYARSNEQLFAAAEQVENLRHSTALLDAARNLKTNKDMLIADFCAIKPSAIPAYTEIDDDTEASMSLVGKKDFEDELNIAAIIRTLESLYAPQLKDLQGKIDHILGDDKNQVTNPASPEALCNCLRDRLASIEESTQAKRTLYIVFQETLLEFLPDLYAEINKLLVTKYGAPEKIVVSRRIKKSHANVQQTNDLYSQVSEEKHISTHETSVDVEKVVAQPAIGIAQPMAAPVASSVVNTASNLLHLIQEPNQQQNNVTEIAATAQEYSAEEINAALAYLQQNAATLDADGHDLQAGLLQGLKNTGAVDKQLSSTDKDNLEVYQRLFATLSNDMLMDDETQAYLQRIQVPIMTQAMKDPGFMESASHPARNIVNHLSSLESAIKDNKQVNNIGIKQLLDDLIGKISKNSVDDPDVFSSVEQELNQITDSVHYSVDRNIKRVVEVYEGQQKLEQARQFVDKKVSQHLSGAEIPKIIVTLLEAGWKYLLVISKLNESSDEYAFQKNLRIIESLSNQLLGVEKINKQQVQKTLGFIDTQMHSVCTNTFLHHKILRELQSFLLKSGAPPDVNSMQMATIEPYKDPQVVHENSRDANEVAQLRVGEWLTFLLAKKIEPLKLVWIGEMPEVFVFVNRKGIKRLELRYDELTELLKGGAANRVESLDIPVMDRATNAMLQKMHEKLIYNATHDPVTDLFNRKEYVKRLKLELSKNDDMQYLLYNIEVEDFRTITNACGLSGGDALLKQLADGLKVLLPKEDFLGRLGDKTLSLLLKDCPPEHAEMLAKKIQSKLGSNHFEYQDKSFPIAVSIGVLPLDSENSYDINAVLQKADSATLAAKDGGRNQIWIYQEDDESLKSQYNLREWAGRIDQVFSDERLFLRCQKIAPVAPEKHTHAHYEILLGINDENGNVIPPDDFIPGVEHCQRMSEIDSWVVQAVFSWIEQHQTIFAALDGFSINLSGESLNSEKFLDFLKHTLSNSNVPLEKITFEITETVAASNVLFVQKFIQQIKLFNCKFSLDDFGSGYSSYSYLKSLDVDYLKIDGIFVKDMPNNKTDVAIVTSMNEIAHSLGLKTIAEYVENAEIQVMLQEIGVDYAQGWGIQKPILLADLT